MKKSLLLIAAVVFAFTMQAQNVFNKGDKMFNAGIGSLSEFGFVPSINASMEVGVIPTGDVGIVSFGGIAAWQLGTYSYLTSSDIYSVFVLGPRASWHLQTFESDKWDVYGGIGFGIMIQSGYTDYWGDRINGYVGPYGEGFIGGRMMLKEGFGLFAETGYGTLSAFKFGVTLSF